MTGPDLENVVDALVNSESLGEASRWQAGLEFYDYLCSIRFNRDGTGYMQKGGGQKMDMEFGFKWQLTGENTVTICYQVTLQTFWAQLGHSFTLNPQVTEKSLTFRLEKGAFAVDEPYIGKRTYGQRLVFSEQPFPVLQGAGLLPAEFYDISGRETRGQIK